MFCACCVSRFDTRTRCKQGSKQLVYSLTRGFLGPDKREYGMVGGAWDPQDGGHPAKDSTALSRTAIRHFKAATGVDLSPCTQVSRWDVHTLELSS